MNAKTLSPTRLVLALVAAGALGGAGATWFQGTHARADVPPVPALAVTAPAAPATSASLPDFAQIAERHGAAVVNISVSGTRKVSNDGGQGMPGLDPRDIVLFRASVADNIRYANPQASEQALHVLDYERASAVEHDDLPGAGGRPPR